MSHVEKIAESDLVGGGSVINRAYPVKFLYIYYLSKLRKQINRPTGVHLSS